MAKKQIPEDYHDMYLEEKFRNINEKLDTLLENVCTKASTSFVNSIDGRLTIIENNQAGCPINDVKTDVTQLKTDRDILMDATEDIRFYKKKPTQFKMLVIGIVVLLLINIIAAIPIMLSLKRNLSEIKKIEKPVTEQIK